MQKRHSSRGMSLIEVLVVVVVVLILLAAAAPSFSTFRMNRQVRTDAENLQAGLRAARSEAVRLRQAVNLVITPGALYSYTVNCAVAGCNGDAPPNLPSTVFFASNGLTAGASTDLATIADAAAFAVPLAAGIGLGAGNAVQFNALGRATGPVRIDVLSPVAGARRLTLVISPGGAIRLCDPALAGGTATATTTLGCA